MRRGPSAGTARGVCPAAAGLSKQQTESLGPARGGRAYEGRFPGGPAALLEPHASFRGGRRGRYAAWSQLSG